MRISDWSSDVCSSDLIEPDKPAHRVAFGHNLRAAGEVEAAIASYRKAATLDYEFGEAWWSLASIKRKVLTDADVTEIRKGIAVAIDVRNSAPRSEEHQSELQSPMRILYAVFSLKQKIIYKI